MSRLLCCCSAEGDGTLESCPSPSLLPTEYYRCELTNVRTKGTFFGTGLNPYFTAWAGYCGEYSAGCGAVDFRWRVHKAYGPPCAAPGDLCTDLAAPTNVVTQDSGSAWYERRPNTFDASASSYAVEIESMVACQLMACPGSGATPKAYSVVNVIFRWKEDADFKLRCYNDPAVSTEHAYGVHSWSATYLRAQNGATWMAAGAYWLHRVVWTSGNANRGMLSSGALCNAGSGDACRDSQWSASPNKLVDTLWTPPESVIVTRYV